MHCHGFQRSWLTNLLSKSSKHPMIGRIPPAPMVKRTGACSTSQSLPTKPLRQMHSQSADLSIHVPPFWHGLRSQSAMSMQVPPTRDIPNGHLYEENIKLQFPAMTKHDYTPPCNAITSHQCYITISLTILPCDSITSHQCIMTIFFHYTLPCD